MKSSDASLGRWPSQGRGIRSRCKLVTRSVNMQRALHRENLMSYADVDWNSLTGRTAAEKRERTTLRDLRKRYLGE